MDSRICMCRVTLLEDIHVMSLSKESIKYLNGLAILHTQKMKEVKMLQMKKTNTGCFQHDDSQRNSREVSRQLDISQISRRIRLQGLYYQYDRNRRGYFKEKDVYLTKKPFIS